MSDRHDDPSQARASAALLARVPLTDRINADPVIFNGLTAAEGSRIAVVCLLLYGAAGAALWLLTRWWLIEPIVMVFGTGATVWYASLYLAKVKRNRPEHYYNQAIEIWLAAWGIGQRIYLLGSRFWSVGRSMPFGGFVSPLVVRARADAQTGTSGQEPRGLPATAVSPSGRRQP